MTALSRPEFWVMRVLMHDGPRGAVQLTLDTVMTMPARVAVNACIAAGKLAVLPDNTIAEPVEVFDTEQEAREHRRKLQAAHPSTDFRVVMNADVPV